MSVTLKEKDLERQRRHHEEHEYRYDDLEDRIITEPLIGHTVDF